MHLSYAHRCHHTMSRNQLCCTKHSNNHQQNWMCGFSPVTVRFAMKVVAVLSAAELVSGHGVMTMPISRSLRFATNASDGMQFAGECPGGEACTWYNQKVVIPGNVTNCNRSLRTMGVSCGDENPGDFVCTPGAAVPWCAPGSAPVRSACGIFSGGYGSNGRDMRDLPGDPLVTWAAGAIAQVGWAITANHGGGYAWRLCKADSDLSEDCFQAGHLQYASDEHRIVDPTSKVVAVIPAVRSDVGTHPIGSSWSRNPFPMELGSIEPIAGLPEVYGRGPFNYSVVDDVLVPHDLEAGHYVLSWRWDAEQTKQVWAQCGDVMVTSRAELRGRRALTLTSSSLPSGQKHVCTGASLGLDVNDCDAWVELYDSLGGANWPTSDACRGQSSRSDPCGCNQWGRFVQCKAKRDYLRITEIYMSGMTLVGVLPESIGELDALVALSLVGTGITGTLPASIGHLPNLEMLWFDHNKWLGGEIPQSFANLKKLSGFELHMSNFTGVLPQLEWASIADCTLNGLVFNCPLPRGAETCGCACK